jgi:hypothetical protein
VKVKLNKKVLYELDGGDRKKVKAFKVKVEAGAISICLPAASQAVSDANGFAGRPSEKTD